MLGLDLTYLLSRLGRAMPIVIVTPHGAEQLATRVLRAGALDYVVQDSALTFLAELPRRLHEAVLRHRYEQMDSLVLRALDSAADGFLILDLTEAIVYVNFTLHQMTGYSRAELLGQTPRLLLGDQHPPSFYTSLWESVRAAGGWQGAVTCRRKDGVFFQSSLQVTSVKDTQGRLTHFLGMLGDRTAADGPASS
jgi:PAS domain S-box-containing protein